MIKEINSLEDWFELAKKGNAQAQYIVATLYETGTDQVAQDYTQAVKYFLRAAKNGYADAMLALCFYYFEGKDKAKGYYWLGKAAKYGNAEAKAIMAGKNPYEKEAPTEQQLVQCREKAEDGDSEAQYYMGLYYLHGLGVKKNEAKAVQFFTKSAEQGWANAMYELYICLMNGIGTERDKKAAAKWFVLAAENRHPEARRYLEVIEDEKTTYIFRS